MKGIALIDQKTKKEVPDFRVGDTLKVHLKVKEGDKSRIQVFEGICIGRKGAGASKSFSVVKETHGDIVEKVFPLYAPTIEKIQVVRKGRFTKAKLNHLKKQTVTVQ